MYKRQPLHRAVEDDWNNKKKTNSIIFEIFDVMLNSITFDTYQMILMKKKSRTFFAVFLQTRFLSAVVIVLEPDCPTSSV